MSDPDELTDDETRVLLTSSRDAFVKVLSSATPVAAGREELNAVEKIRRAFERNAAGGGDPASSPDFPGFEIRERLGQGGFATVFRALDETLRREVALKVITRFPFSDTPSRAGARESFLREARVLASLRHENIVPIHSVIEHDGRFALVMELVEGQSLDSIVQDQGPLGAAEAAQVGSEIARALAAVHGRGLVHRDIKPGNILRARGGRYVLTDFGLGVFLAARDPEQASSGTPLFMSPEQVEGRELDGRSDLYALGVVLYFLVSGEYPYEVDAGTGLGPLFDAIRKGKTIALLDRRSDLPPAFLRVVERALALEPADRYQTAGEFERALREISGPRAPRPSRSRRSMLALGAAAVVLVLIAWRLGSLLFPAGTRALSVTRAELWSVPRDRALHSGDTVQLQEELRLEFEASRDAHVYVLNADARGVVTLLFPHPRSRHHNPLAGGRSYTLPAVEDDRGRLSNWWIDQQGGRERFFVIASVDPLDALEALIDRGGVPREAPEVLAGTLLQQTRSMGLAPARAAAGGRSALALVEQLVDSLQGSATSPSRTGLWAMRIELESP